MAKHPTFVFADGVATEIPKGVVCQNARFVFDRALKMNGKDYLKLVDGQFFLVRNGQDTLIDGKWEL